VDSLPSSSQEGPFRISERLKQAVRNAGGYTEGLSEGGNSRNLKLLGARVGIELKATLNFHKLLILQTDRSEQTHKFTDAGYTAGTLFWAEPMIASVLPIIPVPPEMVLCGRHIFHEWLGVTGRCTGAAPVPQSWARTVILTRSGK